MISTGNTRRFYRIANGDRARVVDPNHEDFGVSTVRHSGAKTVYLRFVVSQIDEDSCVPRGVFMAAGALRDAGALAAHESDLLKSTLDWFRSNLRVPDPVRGGDVPVENRAAVCWFRPDAHDHIRRVRHILPILEEHGRMVTQLTTSDPGYVLYEDAAQVLAVPRRRNLPRRVRRAAEVNASRWRQRVALGR